MRLKLHVALLLCVVGAINLCAQSKTASKSFLTTINQKLDFAVKQEIKMAESVKDRLGKFPVTLDKQGNLTLCDTTSWTCGFFPGTLWYLYEYSKSEQLKQYARQFSGRLEGMQNATNTHDIGFIVYCSYGNGYRLTGDADYKAKVIRAAGSLCTRFSPVTGCIKSWDRGTGVYPVIIDNMMNLELLFEAYKLIGNSKFREIAVAHANTTMKNHFRVDASCYHVVFYDPVTGEVTARKTRQGLADESSWSRGQAWALYGYTMCYRETKDKSYLQQAQKVASFILNHPRLPKDKIPYWDFDDPKISNISRDASAGAVICSALIELSQYVPKSEAKNYLNVAKMQLESLSSPAYLAQDESNKYFLLKHSVGSMPDNIEVDVPLPYADYYYVESLLRFRKVLKGEPLF
jgi:Glycosyl Hydrolase Family 88.